MIQTLAGEFSGVPQVALDDVVGALTQFTPGDTRVEELTITPTLVQRWRIIGFSVQVRIGYFAEDLIGGTVRQFSARLGQLWVGVSAGGGLSDNVGGAQLPVDISTFTKLWDGMGDPPPREIGFGATTSELSFSLLASTFMLPVPLEIYSGSQPSMVMVLTPSLWNLALATSHAGLLIRSSKFSVLYEDAR